MVGRLYHLGRRASRERARELLADSTSTEAGDRLVRTYSGGMRRRLDLAAALVARPPVALPRRADDGPRPPQPHRAVGGDRGARRRGDDGAPDDPVPRRGRPARRPDRRDRPRARDRRGHLRRAEGAGRRRPARDPARGRRAQARTAIAALAPIAEEPPFCEDGSLRVPLSERRGAIAEAVRRLDEAGIGIDDIAVRTPDARRRLPHADRARSGGRARRRAAMSRSQYAVSDTLVLAKRSLSASRASPTCWSASPSSRSCSCCCSSTSSAARSTTPGLDYVDFLMPGIIVQSMVFGGFVTALGLSEDLKKGLIDRFRSLPMWAPAVLVGPDPRRHRDERDPARGHVRRRDRGRLPLLDERPRGRRRDRAAAAVRLRLLVGVRVHRPHRLVAGGRERVRLHDPLPDHVRLVGLRAGRVDARAGCSRSPSTTRSRRWSTRRARCSSARPRATTSGSPIVWSLAITGVFATLSVWRYRRAVAR